MKNEITSRFTEVDQLANGSSANKIIEIRSVYKDGKHTIQPAFNPKTGWYEGVARLSEEDKKSKTYYVTVGEVEKNAYKNTKIKLENGYIFNLNDPIDAINWEWVKHVSCLAMSFAEAQQSKALFYVHIEGREAEEENKVTEDMYEAIKLVMEDPITNYENRALLLGLDMEGEEPATIKSFLLETAKKTPKKIFRIYRDNAMKIYLLFAKALKRGVIIKDEAQSVFRYGNHILGVTEDASIAWLQQQEDILELLERDVNPEYFAKQQDKVDRKDLAANARAHRFNDKDEE
jgi:hypothetical protein